jgi:hypothetical protein
MTDRSSVPSDDLVTRVFQFSRSEMQARGRKGGRVAHARGRLRENLAKALAAREAAFPTPEARADYFKRLSQAGVEARARKNTTSAIHREAA